MRKQPLLAVEHRLTCLPIIFLLFSSHFFEVVVRKVVSKVGLRIYLGEKAVFAKTVPNVHALYVSQTLTFLIALYNIRH